MTNAGARRPGYEATPHHGSAVRGRVCSNSIAQIHNLLFEMPQQQYQFHVEKASIVAYLEMIEVRD